MLCLRRCHHAVSWPNCSQGWLQSAISPAPASGVLDLRRALALALTCKGHFQKVTETGSLYTTGGSSSSGFMAASFWGAGCTPLRPGSPLPLRSQILGGRGRARRLSAALVVSVQCPAEPAGSGPLPPATGQWLLLEGVERPLPPAREMVCQ